MPPIETLLPFLLAALLMGAAPGPDNLYVLAQSLQHGRWAGVWVTLGLCSGLLFHTLAVALGVAALLADSVLAFNLLKVAGALYLLYLAWQAFRAGAANSAPVAALTPPRLYRRGVLMNISNPKISIFFLAFLPQFASPVNGPLAPQLLLLGALFMLTTLLVFGALAWSAGGIGQRIQGSSSLQRRLHQLAGMLFVGLSLRLLLSAQNH